MAPKRTCLWLLIALLITLTATATSTTRAATCGDIDSNGDGPDIGDLTQLINHLFIDFRPLDDPGLANVVDDGVVDIADLTAFINHLFLTFEPLTCYPVEGDTTSSIRYPIVDTDQSDCYGTSTAITPPQPGETYYGQDAQYDGNQMSYTNNGDSTITDNVTGLMWTKSADLNGDGVIDYDDKLTFDEALDYPDTLNAHNFAGYNDWRLPSIKEIYSLMNFSGTDPSGPNPTNMIPFIDTSYFDFAYGDESAGERLIDAQWWTTSVYTGLVFGNQEADFGLNLADGRIKGYPTSTSGPVTKLNYVYLVRGNTSYGINDFYDNGDGTVTDSATNLMWSQDDFGDGATTGPRSGMTWVDALAFVEQKNNENYLGYTDWRLPNAKELQSIVDYSRGPDATNSGAIDPIFNITQITNELGDSDYPWFWTSTTHVSSELVGDHAAYICFGRATGYMNGQWLDVHGAGCQRSDKKDGDFSGFTYVSDGYYFLQAPQGDAARLYNYVRLVRDADAPAAELTEVTLFAPQSMTTTYLMDENEDVINTWESSYRPGLAAYLLDDNSLLRTAHVTNNSVFDAGGAGGRVEQYDWDGNLTWEFEYNSSVYLTHHDVEPLPNGNILMIAWEYKNSTEATDAGRDPDELVAGELWPDMVIEVEPTGSSGGNIVWEWHAWDHLIQDYDNTKDNYGVVADHPEKVNLNYIQNAPIADWLHINGVDYNAELDQIMLTVHNFSEIWVIDHNTTTAEAAGSAGDLLYRWGNPQAYDRGTEDDKQLFVPHDGRWIEDGSPGVGDILVFNNGQNRPDGNYSTVDQFTPPEDGSGGYILDTDEAFGPSAPNWTYQSDPPSEFYGQNISGAQRLPDGNTLICEGPEGRFFEVTPDGAIVWEYINPYSGAGPAGNAVFRANRYWRSDI